jgi:hypothetical protein
MLSMYSQFPQMFREFVKQDYYLSIPNISHRYKNKTWNIPKEAPFHTFFLFTLFTQDFLKNEFLYVHSIVHKGRANQP